MAFYNTMCSFFMIRSDVHCYDEWHIKIMLFLPFKSMQSDWLGTYTETQQVGSFGSNTEAQEYLNQVTRIYFFCLVQEVQFNYFLKPLMQWRPWMSDL